MSPILERNAARVHILTQLEHDARYGFAIEQLQAHTTGSGSITVLECPAGTGEGAKLLRAAGIQVEGVDYDPDAVQTAIRKHGGSFRVGNMLELTDFADASFNGVVSMEGIEHVTFADADRVLKNFLRLLKPGGILVMSTPNRLTYAAAGTNPFHLHEYTPDEMHAKLRDAGYGDIRHYGQELEHQDLEKLYRNRTVNTFTLIKRRLGIQGPIAPKALMHAIEKLVTGKSTAGMTTANYRFVLNGNAPLMLFVASRPA